MTKKRYRLQAPLKTDLELKIKLVDKQNKAPQKDEVDTEVNAYVLSFFEEATNCMKIGDLSLSSPQNAEIALKKINSLRKTVDNHRRTAKALKQMLELYKSEAL